MEPRPRRGDPKPQSDILQRFEAAVTAIQDSESFRRWLDISARFHKYSLGNQLLIAMQRPDATYVAGYHTWPKLGRHVKRVTVRGAVPRTAVASIQTYPIGIQPSQQPVEMSPQSVQGSQRVVQSSPTALESALTTEQKAA